MDLSELADIELETELLASREALRALRSRVRPGRRPPRRALFDAAEARNRVVEAECQRRRWF